MLIIIGRAYACGISLAEPKSHYDRVDYQGHVHFIEKLSDLNSGKDGRLKIPIYIIFNSGSGYRSPYSGSFDIPLLTSRIEQVDENMFLLRSPSGWLLPFVRNGKEKGILDGSNGMKAVIDDNKGTITAWANCGDKLTFLKGRLIEWQIKDVKLNYIYSGDKVSEIRRDGATILKVIFDSQGEVEGLSLGLEQTIAFEWAKQPIVRSIQGKTVISELQNTLGKIRLPNGTLRTFEFSVDEQSHPTLKIDNQGLISWDPETFLIQRDGGWSYNIEQASGRFANAKISRSNQEGTESWFYNGEKGEESVGKLNGTIIFKSFFTAGRLSGRPRSVKKISDGKEVTLNTWSYDERGRLIRAYALMGKGRTFTYEYDDKGNQTRINVDGSPWITKKYDEFGKLKEKTMANGIRKIYQHSNDGIRQTTVFLDGSSVVKDFDKAYRMTRSPTSIPGDNTR